MAKMRALDPRNEPVPTTSGKPGKVQTITTILDWPDDKLDRIIAQLTSDLTAGFMRLDHMDAGPSRIEYHSRLNNKQDRLDFLMVAKRLRELEQLLKPSS